jgi:hypothetical protein
MVCQAFWHHEEPDVSGVGKNTSNPFLANMRRQPASSGTLSCLPINVEIGGKNANTARRGPQQVPDQVLLLG